MNCETGFRVVSLEALLRESPQVWASVSYCAGSKSYCHNYGPKPITRHVFSSRSAAYKAKAIIDQDACGGGCAEWHAVEPALPHERAGRIYTVTRDRYRAYGGTIPDIFLLPGERSRLPKKHYELKDRPQYRFRILKRDGYRCQICGAAASNASDVRLHVDHIIPKIKGGTDDPANLWTLCSRCNLGKGIEDI